MQTFFKDVKNLFVNTILIGFLATFSVGGAWKGGLKTVFSLLSFVIAFVISISFYQVFSDFLFKNNFLITQLSGFIEETLGSLNGKLVDQTFSSLSDMLDWLENTELPYYGKSIINSILKNTSFDGNFTISQVIIIPIYKIALESISFILIFMFSFALLKILQYFLQKVISISFFKITDRVLGFLIGIIFGVAIYFVLIYFLTLLSQVLLSDFLIEKLKEGYLSSIFYSYLTK